MPAEAARWHGMGWPVLAPAQQPEGAAAQAGVCVWGPAAAQRAGHARAVAHHVPGQQICTAHALAPLCAASA